MRIDESDDDDEIPQVSSKSLDQELFGDSGDEEVVQNLEDDDKVDDVDLFGEDEGEAIPEEYPEYDDYGEEEEPKKLITVEALLPDTQGPKDNENVREIIIIVAVSIENTKFLEYRHASL